MALSLEEKCCMAIGAMAVNSATLEGRFAAYLSWMTGLKLKLCQAIMDGEFFITQLKIVNNVFRERIETETQLKEFRALVKRIGDAEDKRNFYAHSQLFGTNEGIPLFDKAPKKSLKSGHKRGLTAITLSELEGDSKELQTATSMIEKFMAKTFDRTPWEDWP